MEHQILKTNCLTLLSRIEFSIINIWTSPLTILEVSDVLFQSLFYF